MKRSRVDQKGGGRSAAGYSESGGVRGKKEEFSGGSVWERRKKNNDRSEKRVIDVLIELRQKGKAMKEKATARSIRERRPTRLASARAFAFVGRKRLVSWKEEMTQQKKHQEVWRKNGGVRETGRGGRYIFFIFEGDGRMGWREKNKRLAVARAMVQGIRLPREGFDAR